MLKHLNTPWIAAHALFLFLALGAYSQNIRLVDLSKLDALTQLEIEGKL